ncbi:hypothetical protein [Methanolobus bombayensis]|uniref:hypothetical protein n=1 Tax=Methanolobus bombayensis TaxID=38023 RepID=UPI001AE20989|nr:hypothetical protein [Methanolobus bombayensis]MBP1909731.1 hypothetical protein [Methanolobus bombayensis]
MKKMPLAVLIILMLLVVISGMTGSDSMQQYPEKSPDSYNYDNKAPAEVYSPPKETMMDHMFILSFPMDEERFLEDNIEKSEFMVERLENATVKLENEGNDVSELKDMIKNYADLVSESRIYLEKANSASSESAKQEYLDLSRKSIIQSNSRLRPIMGEIKKYLPGPVIIENNILSAEGNGVAILSGDLDLDFSLSDGKFSVVDLGEDLVIDAAADYRREFVPDKETSPEMIMSHSMISYVEVTGNVSMSGSAYTVAIISDMIVLNASGNGEAELIGNGTYHLDGDMSAGKENVWMIPIFERTDVGK